MLKSHTASSSYLPEQISRREHRQTGRSARTIHRNGLPYIHALLGTDADLPSSSHPGVLPGTLCSEAFFRFAHGRC